MSTGAVGLVLAIVAAASYGAFVLYGAAIDGRRQAICEKGQHPVTEQTGAVHAREGEENDGDERT